MGTTDIALERIFRQLISGNAGLAIGELETYLAAWSHAQSRERLDELKAEYTLMASYWQQGVRDPQLENLYRRLLQRVYVLSANIAVYRHLRASSYLTMLYNECRKGGRSWTIDGIRREMEDFVSGVAMLELEPEHLRNDKSLALYRQHQQQMNLLFNYIVTSNIWTDGVGHEMEELLLSPTVDTIDQQLLVSAVTLSLMNRFDMAKFRLLVNVYRRSGDEQVRQRALVGWALSIDDDFAEVYPEQRDLVAQLLQSKRACRELTELQMQLIYTLNAEKDTTTIREEIMPDIVSNAPFRITQDGYEEIPDDPMEDVLNPDAAEQRMEKIEASYKRMLDMQQQGADVYFGGFSQMKRFPFFYDMSNWLVPFYLQHPDISQFVQRLSNRRFLELLVQKGSFCNSDKYSFVIVFQQVVDRLPDSFQQMLKRGEAQLGVEMSDEELRAPAFIRRSYLMDLYRFFRLFPNRSALCNPFDTAKHEAGMCLFFSSQLFDGTPLEASKREVVAMLRKQRLMTTAALLLDTFPEHMFDAQYYVWKGDYERAAELEPTNERALAGWARIAFSRGDYQVAVDAYDRLLLLHPDKTGYMLNKAVCQVKMEDYDDALRLLYQLNYEHADDDNVNRVLAWTLTCAGKLEQAEKLFRQLTNADQPTGEDYQNMGYCLWLMGRVGDAAAAFRRYVEIDHVPTDTDFLDKAWLSKHGISDIDVKMMQALVVL